MTACLHFSRLVCYDVLTNQKADYGMMELNDESSIGICEIVKCSNAIISYINELKTLCEAFIVYCKAEWGDSLSYERIIKF